MARIIKKVDLPPKLAKRKRVAAYARVSTGKDAMLHSLSAQVAYYSNYIQSHDGWEYVGVYADEALTGTKDTRDEFQRLLQDCRAGKIDLVITKAISRFARNTVTLLESVRELKNLGIDIYFEEQNIHTMSADGELMLTILASYAQEESLSASENQKWRIKANFEQGLLWHTQMIGYKQVDGAFVIVPQEAEIVRRIFTEYLNGKGYCAIAKGLNADGIFTRKGVRWEPGVIAKLLKNYNYTGNLILQKTYRENHITKKRMVNRGELPQYHATNTHEAIIPLEMYNAVQAERERRALCFHNTTKVADFSAFTGILVCEGCGKHYRRKTTRSRIMWVCSTYNSHGKSACASKQIPETTLQEMVSEVLGRRNYDEQFFRMHITQITVCNGNRLIFQMANGTVIEKEWKDRSRSESWTPEMRALAGQKTKRRYELNG